MASSVPNAGSRWMVNPAALAPTAATPRFQKMNATTEAISPIYSTPSASSGAGHRAGACSATSATAGSSISTPASEITKRNGKPPSSGGRRLSSTE